MVFDRSDDAEGWRYLRAERRWNIPIHVSSHGRGAFRDSELFRGAAADQRSGGLVLGCMGRVLVIVGVPRHRQRRARAAYTLPPAGDLFSPLRDRKLYPRATQPASPGV